MKAILCFIALLAIVSASAHRRTSRVNFKDLYLGFTEELEFSEQEHQELRQCASEVTTTVQKYYHGKAALAKQLLAFFFAEDSKHREGITAVLQYVHTAFPSCGSFLVSMHTKFVTEVGISEVEKYIPKRQLIPFRISRHMDVFVSSIISIVDDLKSGDAESAGEHIAYLLEIATGLWHPETIQDYIKEYVQPVEVSVLEPERFVKLALEEAFATLGTEVKVPEHLVKNLIEAVQGFIEIYATAQSKLHNTPTFIERQVVIMGAARDLVKAGAVALENVKLILTPFLQQNAHHLQGLTGRRAALRVLKNYYKHLPYLQEHVVDLGMSLRAHKPAATGHAIARVFQTLAGKR
jgi:hypothetical protein